MMNNLPLQPLVWTDTLTTTTIFRTYKVRLDVKGRFSVYYESSTGKPATGFISVDDAKHWAEFTHYASQMQPYVKPLPTWIDVNERLPEEDGLYLAHYPDQPYKQKIVFFRSNINKFNLFHELITHWMPLPDAPKESNCD